MSIDTLEGPLAEASFFRNRLGGKMSLDLQSERERAVRHVEERLDGVVDRVDDAFAPILNAARSVLQSVIWLSGGGLVVSISLAQIFLDERATLEWGFLLPVAWGLLAGTIMLALVGMSRYLAMRSVPIEVEKQKTELREAARELYDDDDAGIEKLNIKVRDIYKKAWEEPKEAVRVHDKCYKASIYTFLLGLGVLVTFAIINVPVW